MALEVRDNRLEGWARGEFGLLDGMFTILQNPDHVFNGMIFSFLFIGMFGRLHGLHGPFAAGTGLAIAVDLIPPPSGRPGAGHLRTVKVLNIVGDFVLWLYTMY